MDIWKNYDYESSKVTFKSGLTLAYKTDPQELRQYPLNEFEISAPTLEEGLLKYIHMGISVFARAKAKNDNELFEKYLIEWRDKLNLTNFTK